MIHYAKHALPAPHYIAQFFVTSDDPNISRILSRASLERVDIALPRHAELPEGFIASCRNCRADRCASQRLTILLLVLLPVNYAGSPTPWRGRRKPPSPDRNVTSALLRRVLFRRYRYRFKHRERDSAFYCGKSHGMHPAKYRTSASTSVVDAETLQMRSKPVSGQLCLPGPPGPFVVALPRLNLYKWVRALSSFRSRSFHPSASVSRSSSSRSRVVAAAAVCPSTHRHPALIKDNSCNGVISDDRGVLEAELLISIWKSPPSLSPRLFLSRARVSVTLEHEQ